jgi:hypothetical protein
MLYQSDKKWPAISNSIRVAVLIRMDLLKVVATLISSVELAKAIIYISTHFWHCTILQLGKFMVAC